MKFIVSLGYGELTLKSNTEPSSLSENRDAEGCRAEVTEDAVKGDKQVHGLEENASDAAARIRQNATLKVPRKTQSETIHQCCIPSRSQKGRDGRTQCERLHGKRPHQEVVPFAEKVRARPNSADLLNRINPRYKFNTWLGNSAECTVGTTEEVFRAREVRRLEPKVGWDKERINNMRCHGDSHTDDR